MGNGKWASAELECVVCGREWVGAFPLDVPALECPDCGHMNEGEVERVRLESNDE